ncbi:hypothetical protein SBOR_7310 [Sclerotinia borealis F-4128]|uniref:Ribosome biogenesis protein ALB1 n=1 Tax=Sclerotinia borealis (strain F-4128) TaxID=1432307 RepID=W9CBX0_SCLBF|nr:hypothetical protein SBOR_7310 [Sclerotinia borealis F-4128]
MASKSNPNVPQKQRRVANRSKTQRKNAVNHISKNARGTRTSTVLHPTSGPLAPVSGKKARKLQKAQNCARQRALEQALKEEAEVKMTDAPTEGEGMEIDNAA